MQEAKKKPAFKGLTWHRHKYFSFFIPIDWQQFQWQDGRDGVVFGPTPDDPHTVFAVDWKSIDSPFEPDDLEFLEEGFLGAIRGLPEINLESHNSKIVGKIMILEAKYTFQEETAVRKRWVRVIYHQNRQIAFVAQGRSPDSFDYWLPMFYETMMTVKTHNKAPDSEDLDKFL